MTTSTTSPQVLTGAASATSGSTLVTGTPAAQGPEVAGLKLIPPFPPHAVPQGARPAQISADHFPRLPVSERDRRWDGIRKKMLMAGVDVLILLGNDIYWDMGIANLRYVMGVGAKMGSHALFFMDAPPVLYNAVAHMSRPFHHMSSVSDWIDDIRISRGIPEIAAELRDRGYGGSRIGIVGFSSTIQTVPTFLHGELQALTKCLPNADIVDFSYALQEMRMIKSEVEISLMRSAGKIARDVLDTLVSSAKPGATEAEVYADMVRTQIASGAEPNIFNLFASGPIDHPSEELWHLLHGADQPTMPTTRPLAEGDLIVTEWHTKYAGYLVHTEYTVHVGPNVPRELRNIWDVSLECLDISQQVLKAGNTLREAWEEIRKPCDKAGYDFVELGFHAMGLASPEFPTVIYRPGYGGSALNGDRIGDLVLEEGMTLGNNIDLHNPAWKPDVGCMLADFMVVRENGAELLIGTPREIGIGGQ